VAARLGTKPCESGEGMDGRWADLAGRKPTARGPVTAAARITSS